MIIKRRSILKITKIYVFKCNSTLIVFFWWIFIRIWMQNSRTLKSWKIKNNFMSSSFVLLIRKSIAMMWFRKICKTKNQIQIISSKHSARIYSISNNLFEKFSQTWIMQNVLSKLSFEYFCMLSRLLKYEEKRWRSYVF